MKNDEKVLRSILAGRLTLNVLERPAYNLKLFVNGALISSRREFSPLSAGSAVRAD